MCPAAETECVTLVIGPPSVSPSPVWLTVFLSAVLWFSTQSVTQDTCSGKHKQPQSASRECGKVRLPAFCLAGLKRFGVKMYTRVKIPSAIKCPSSLSWHLFNGIKSDLCHAQAASILKKQNKSEIQTKRQRDKTLTATTLKLPWGCFFFAGLW